MKEQKWLEDFMEEIEVREKMINPLGGIATNCLICGEGVAMKNINDTPKICDKCKAAVMKVRKESED